MGRRLAEGSLRPPSKLSHAAFAPSRLRAAEVSFDSVCGARAGHVQALRVGHARVRVYRATAFLRSPPDRERTAQFVRDSQWRSLAPTRQADAEARNRLV